MKARPTGHAMRPRQTLRPRPPRAFTLIELLIAMTLTLMLVYAIAQFYAYVGETVRDGRGQIEMGGQLRAAAQRLQQDLAELTVRVGGRIDTGTQEGVLELVEGIASDADPDGNQVINVQWVDANNDGVPDNDLNGDLKPDGPMLGDCDDILVMTIRSQGEPFVGRWYGRIPGSNPPQYAYQLVQSNLAEVIWFTTFTDLSSPPDGMWQPNEPRYLMRRQLLIRPDLITGGGPNTLTYPGYENNQSLPIHENVFHHNDISAHYEYDSVNNRSRWVPNSLGDLSRRENRFIHLNFRDYTNLDSLNNPILTGNGLRDSTAYLPNPALLQPFNMLPLVDASGNPINNPLNTGSILRYSLQNTSSGQFLGEDKMLSNLLAFDMRVFDPYAVLRADHIDADGTLSPGNPNDNATGVLSPGDPGYPAAILANEPAAPNTPFPMMGTGAYVDLWYNRGLNNAAVYQNTAYSWAPNSTLPPPPPYPQIPPQPDPQWPWPLVTVNFRPFVATGPAIWETWTTAYEKDGLNQLPDGNTGILNYNRSCFDWMVDGLDNGTMAFPPSGGVDDPTESDTRMPYPSWVGDNGVDDNGDGTVDEVAEQNYVRRTPTTLRGIEVRIRMYEPGTRQARQTTVATDFIPE
jgi:prepilin-type N-terminal cleavage/methylation domain-containing protein